MILFHRAVQDLHKYQEFFLKIRNYSHSIGYTKFETSSGNFEFKEFFDFNNFQHSNNFIEKKDFFLEHYKSFHDYVLNISFNGLTMVHIYVEKSEIV